MPDCEAKPIFVDASFEVALERAILRDQDSMGGMESTRARYVSRYYPGQRIYLESVRPRELADVVVINNDFEDPALIIRDSG